MITITLDPRIAKQLGVPQSFRAVASTVLEAVRCLRVNWPAFDQWLNRAAEAGAQFIVQVGNQLASEDQINYPIESKVQSLRISLVPSGAGDGDGGGFLRIIAGAALLGLGLAGVGFLGIGAKTIAMLGASLLIQGISSFFGRVNDPSTDEANGKRSLIFGSPKQTVTEGGRVPIVYGVHLTGLNIISGRIQSAYQPA